jgi:putative membrane protein
MLTKADHKKIAAAIAAAEAKTSGEIYCIVTDEVSKYREVPIAWGAAAALLAPPAALLIGLRPWALGSVGAGWSDAPNLGDVVSEALAGYAVIQALIFAAVALIVAAPPVRRALTPTFLKRRRVKQVALTHLSSTGMTQADHRTGVLIFAALKDRQVELLADAAIHKEVGDAAWAAAVAALVRGVKSADPASGFVEAVGICGAALEAHFPAKGPHAQHGDGVVEF